MDYKKLCNVLDHFNLVNYQLYKQIIPNKAEEAVPFFV